MKNSTVNIGYVSFLAIVAAIGGFLFGYDTAVISGTVSQVADQFNLDAMQTGWYVGCALLGSIIGVIFAGPMGDKLGRKVTMILAALLFTASAVGCAVSTTYEILVIFRIIGGIGI
ncbi:MAG: MFS transporter, partial [Bacteroidales bacterium]